MASWPLIDVDALAGMGQEAAALIAELARPGSPFSPQSVAADAIDAVEALRARFQEQGLFCKWRKGAPSALLWALEETGLQVLEELTVGAGDLRPRIVVLARG